MLVKNLPKIEKEGEIDISGPCQSTTEVAFIDRDTVTMFRRDWNSELWMTGGGGVELVLSLREGYGWFY